MLKCSSLTALALLKKKGQLLFEYLHGNIIIVEACIKVVSPQARLCKTQLRTREAVEALTGICDDNLRGKRRPEYSHWVWVLRSG